MKKTIGAFAATLALLAPFAAHAQEATVSANVGFLSDYYYRGIFQNESSASAGLDVGVGPVYLGTWGADVGNGAEIDLYGGVGTTVGELSLSVGGTGYFYTGDFDETYLEGNASAGYGPLTVDVAIGTYDSDPSQDYGFFSVTAAHEGLYGTFGTFFSDFEGSYVEAGYGFTAGEMDFTVSGIFSDETLAGQEDGELTFVFGISKTFDIR